MNSVFWKWTVVLIAGTFGAWIGTKFLLPAALPFLLGGLLAVAAEPAVSFGAERLKLPRTLASFLGVALSLLILAGLLVTLGGFFARQVGTLAQKMPDMDSTLQGAEKTLLSLSEKAPGPIRSLAQKTIHQTMDDSSALLGQVAGKIPGMVSGFFGKVAGSALGIGTGILAAFFISLRLPKLRNFMRENLPAAWKEKYLPAIRRFRDSLMLWAKAQGKLILVTWGIVTAGLFALGIRKAPLWALFVALLDALPVLGTGVVLLPWSAVSFLQGETLRAVGILGIYAVAAVTRAVLEPRVVGRNLGLDPLLTLVAMYAGFRFFGIGGMLLTPILTSAVKNAVKNEE